VLGDDMCDGIRVGVGGAGFVGLSTGDGLEIVLDVDKRGDDWEELGEEIDESLLGKGTGRLPRPVVLMVWPEPACAGISEGSDCASTPPSEADVREDLAVLGFGSGCLLGEANDSSGTFTYWCLLSGSSSTGTLTYSGRCEGTFM